MRAEAVEIDTFATDLANAEALLEAKVEKWRRLTRESLEGHPLEAIQLLDGTVIEKAEIAEVTDEALVLSTAGGRQSIPYDQLPETIRLLVAHRETVLTQGRVTP